MQMKTLISTCTKDYRAQITATGDDTPQNSTESNGDRDMTSHCLMPGE